VEALEKMSKASGRLRVRGVEKKVIERRHQNVAIMVQRKGKMIS
jgi:hypothetical protein